MLSFQRLDVYQVAVAFAGRTLPLQRAMRRGDAALRGQLRRAVISIPLNIAEGAGRVSAADAARHYAIARGSAMECAAILDLLHGVGGIDDDEHRDLTAMLGRIVAMLTRLCQPDPR